MMNFKTLYFLIVVFVGKAALSFEPTYRRTLSGNDWFRTFKHHFPLAMMITPQQFRSNYGTLADQCKWRSVIANEGLIGDLNPSSNEYHPSKPNATFITWVTDCLKYIANDDLEIAITKNLWKSRLLPENGRNDINDEFISSHWKDISDAKRNQIVTFQLKRLIGPVPIKNQSEWLKKINEQILKRNLSVKEAYLMVVVLVAARPEFMNY